MRFDIIRLDLDPLLRSNSQLSLYFAISFHTVAISAFSHTELGPVSFQV